MKRSFFQAVFVSILLYGSTTWTQTKRLEKKLDGNYTRMLQKNVTGNIKYPLVELEFSLFLSLSLSLYIYIYIHVLSSDEVKKYSFFEINS